LDPRLRGDDDDKETCVWGNIALEYIYMAHIWDYDINELKKTESGRRLILERQINYGVDWEHGEKIKLSEVKKNWNKLHMNPLSRRLLEMLIWEK